MCVGTVDYVSGRVGEVAISNFSPTIIILQGCILIGLKQQIDGIVVYQVLYVTASEFGSLVRRNLSFVRTDVIEQESEIEHSVKRMTCLMMALIAIVLADNSMATSTTNTRQLPHKKTEHRTLGKKD